MYQLQFLKKENDLNKLIKQNKRYRNNLSILFVSLWDKFSTNLVEKVTEKYGDSDRGEILYIVDSFNMPHSFVIYNATKAPCLVQLRRDRVYSEDYYSMIMKTLRIK